MDNWNDNCMGEIEPELKNAQECWIGKGSMYGLCIGNGSEKCLKCPVYED